jgi:hypothetical protein
MKKIKWIGIALIISGFAISTLAQGPRSARKYDPKTEVTVRGNIEQVQEQAGRHGWLGTHVLLKTETGILPVHVGPSGYIAKKQFAFATGDEIEVVGSKVLIAGKETLLARQITKEGKSLVLRNLQGIPEWAGGRWRN